MIDSPELLAELERRAADETRRRGHCPYPHGTIANPKTCLCGQPVTLDPDDGWAHDWWLELRAELRAGRAEKGDLRGGSGWGPTIGPDLAAPTEGGTE